MQLALRYLQFLFWLLLFISCETDPESNLVVSFINDSSEKVRLHTFNGVNIMRIHAGDTLIINPGDKKSFKYSRRGEYLPSDISNRFGDDSLNVVFGDTVSVVHYSSRINNPSNVGIFFDDPRNLYNKNSYSIEKVDEDSYFASYSFTEDDRENALSNYE